LNGILYTAAHAKIKAGVTKVAKKQKWKIIFANKKFNSCRPLLPPVVEYFHFMSFDETWIVRVFCS
jgi:hypothetical protein